MMYELVMVVMMIKDNLPCQKFSHSLPLCLSVFYHVVFAGIFVYAFILLHLICLSVWSPRFFSGHNVRGLI